MEKELPTDTRTDLQLPTSLFQLLKVSLVLYQLAPYLPPASLLALGATSHAFKTLIHETPFVISYLDLSKVPAAQSKLGSIDHGGEVWRNVQLDENVTEDDFYGGPLRGIFNNIRKRCILQDVQTLILDGLAVPADLVTEIITNDSFNIRILSIRDVQHLNERKLQQALLYAIRPTRRAGTPKLRGMYIFGPKESGTCTHDKPSTESVPVAPGVTTILGAQLGAQWNPRSEAALAVESSQNGWFSKPGKIFHRTPSAEWALTIQACLGLISFDAVLCKGPRHSLVSAKGNQSLPWYCQPENHFPPRVADFALNSGCSGCGKAPEGLRQIHSSPLEDFPLMAPPPLHSSTLKAAKQPSGDILTQKLLVRCSDCLSQRHCENSSCHKWWCEDCYRKGDNILSEQGAANEGVKVYTDLCVDSCLVREMMSGAGSSGMWG